MNWNMIVKAVAAEGYTGATDDAAAVAAFVKTNNIVIKHNGNTVDVIEAHKARPVREINVVDERVDEIAGEVERMKSRARGAAAVHTATMNDSDNAPATFAIGNAVRKKYDREAKSGRDYAGPKRTAFACADDAELFGAWVKTAIMPQVATAEDRAIVAKSGITTTNTLGGAVVPDIFVPQLIDLREVRGAARQVLDVMTVGSDVVQMPRRTGGVTVYWPGEAGSITASDPTLNNVQVVANKMTAFTTVSNELLNDSAISFADFVAREHAYAMADKEDEAVFNGDGTSTYGGHTGFRSKIASLSGTVANIAGYVVGSGSSYSALTLADFEAVVGRAPSYVDSANPVWVVHKEFYWNVMARLALAAGGVTSIEIANGIRQPIFLGAPVVFSQVMPRITAGTQICALYGAFNLAAKAIQVGGGMQIATDASVGFQSDTTAFRGVNRFGVTVHDVGNASATASARVPGAVVCLATS